MILNSNDQKSFGEKVWHFSWDLVKVVCISLAIIIPVRYFLIQPFYVKGASMEPSFYDHEYLIVDEISYNISNPNRGDVLVFKYPKDPSQYFIKRIIGLPGETVEVADGVVYVYPKDKKKRYLLNEDYLSFGEITYGNKTLTLNEGEYFVLGDNRDQSLDSRSFGPVNKEMMIGKVWFRGWPLNRINFFEDIDYKLDL